MRHTKAFSNFSRLKNFILLSAILFLFYPISGFGEESKKENLYGKNDSSSNSGRKSLGNLP